MPLRQTSALRFPRKLLHDACAFCLLTVVLAAPLTAQNQTPEPPSADLDSSAATMTLHVYAAHLQMPALVLSPNLHTIPALPADRFNIRLDGGTPFGPSAVRLEGEDPITLAVLLDAGGGNDQLIEEIMPALVQLRMVALHPQDDLLLYAIDCKTVRYSIAVPHSAAAVERAVRAVLGSSDLHRGSTLPVCGGSLHLWDAAATIVTTLAKEPGRRVLLALTTGKDRASQIAWSSLRSYAGFHSVALFAFVPPQIARAANLAETPLWNLCSLTGGLLLPVYHPGDLPGSMDNLLALLRQRYILEFPRSNRLAGGNHLIEVQVREAPRALIRLTGMSVPILDQKLRDDPTTVPYLEADRPTVGEHRPLPAAGSPK